MATIPDIKGPIRCQIPPSTWITIRILILETRLVPALSQIMGSKDPDEELAFDLLFPLRALLVTENLDGTYAVLNDLRTIAPEASRSNAEYVIGFLVEFDSDRPKDEAALRTLLALVEPVRQARTVRQYIKDAQRGAFDALAPLYAGNRVDPRKRVAASSMLPFGQIVPSTFQRICKALVIPQKKTKAENNNETGPSKSAAPPTNSRLDQQRQTQNEDRILIDAPSLDIQDLGTGEQGELF